MAMLDICFPSAEQVRKEFDEAAKAGHKILLNTELVLSDELVIHVYPSTEAVKSEDEIVPLLESFNRGRGCYEHVSLQGVMDLTRSFDDQLDSAVRMEIMLSEKTRADIKDFERRLSVKQAQLSWSSLPFYKRWLTRFPAGEHRMG